MNDCEFNTYLSKFRDSYKITVEEDGIRVIIGKYGKVYPYDPKNQLLGVCGINLTTRRIKLIFAQLSTTLQATICPYEGDKDYGLVFNEKYLDDVCKIIKVRKRKKMTDEQKKELAIRLGKNK